MAAINSKRYLEIILRFIIIRRIIFTFLKLYLAVYRFYLEAFRHKPKSVNLLADAHLPIGLVRMNILKGLGISDEDMRGKPLVAIANSWCEMNPGHKHLRELAQAVREGVWEAGGVPFEFNVPAPCDAVSNGNDGMKYVLAQRDLIADMVEMYVRSQWFDGMVTISSCDKINPGMLMASARLNIATICVPGGPGMMNIRNVPGANRGVDHKGYEDIGMKLQTSTCATCGACEVMGTANTVQCLMEALGMALPGSAAVPAFMSEKSRFAREAGKRIVAMIREDLTPRKLMTREALLNAVMVDMAIGGSTNSTLHLPALARELGVKLTLKDFNEQAKRIPTLTGIAPSGPHGVVDLYRAGGIPAVMKRLEKDIYIDCVNVIGKTWREILPSVEVLDPSVIREKISPYNPEGGTVALFGTLAPDGSVVKQSAVREGMRVFTGRALVFDCEADALAKLPGMKVEPGTVVVIRYEGPKGAPGMPEMLSVTMLIEILGMNEVALVTDGRFSGATSGPCIGHVSPEAYDGGPIALVQDGDQIEIDIPGRKLELKVGEAELKARREKWVRVERPVERGYMDRYRRMVSSAAEGAVIK